MPTADTLEHDITMRDGRVFLHNSCCDTTTLHNGVLAQMNPSEGYWLFKVCTLSRAIQLYCYFILDITNSNCFVLFDGTRERAIKPGESKVLITLD